MVYGVVWDRKKNINIAFAAPPHVGGVFRTKLSGERTAACKVLEMGRTVYRYEGRREQWVDIRTVPWSEQSPASAYAV